jgi:hypothetical protein
MAESGAGATSFPEGSVEVEMFSRRFKLEKSLEATRKLIQAEFGEALVELNIAVQDDIAEEDEVPQLLVVEIVFRGSQPSFHNAYRRFVSAWVKAVPDAHHKLIQFRFHIVN